MTSNECLPVRLKSMGRGDLYLSSGAKIIRVGGFIGKIWGGAFNRRVTKKQNKNKQTNKQNIISISIQFYLFSSHKYTCK